MSEGIEYKEKRSKQIVKSLEGTVTKYLLIFKCLIFKQSWYTKPLHLQAAGLNNIVYFWHQNF